MMKRLFAVGFFSFIVLTIYAQSDLLIPNNDKIIGKNDKTNSDIHAMEYVFPERIYDSYIDTLSNLLTIQLRNVSNNGKWLKNSGNVVLYDLSNKKVKWSKKIKYQLSSIEQFNNVIIQRKGNASYCLNNENGKDLWKVQDAIYYVNSFEKIGIGYKYNIYNGSYTNNLEGIDLTNGKTIWHREINREYSWNDILHLNDSVIIVVAAGLHSINIKNGTGWDYNTITGKKDYDATIAANAAGVAVGLLTGAFVISTGHDLVRDIVSNVLVDSSDIYFASKEKIARLDYNGNIKWTHTLPKDLVSKSVILLKDSLIYMINKGYAYMGYRQLDFGMPFIAAFNKNTGEQVFLTIVKDKKNLVNGIKINNDTAILVFNNRISEYSMINGSAIYEKSFNTDVLGELMYFINEQIYIKTDSAFKCLVTSDPTNKYLCTKGKKILVIDNDLNISDQIDFCDLYIYYFKTKNYKFLSKDDETTVIDNENKKVADLKVSRKATLIGSKLYDMQEKSLIEVDINEFMKN